MTTDLILPGSEAEADALAEAAADILGAVERGLDGRWRMPWHAFASRPTNAFSGRAFKGQNVLALWAAARRGRFTTHLWASAKGWETNGDAFPLAGARGALILVPVFDEDAPPARWTADSRGKMAKKLGPIGGDPLGGEIRTIKGFVKERWYNIAEVAPAPTNVKHTESPAPSIGAERAVELTAAWRANRGPGLIHGGLRAFWDPSVDRITIPPVDAFAPHQGLSGREYYAATLLHEHIHATGSKNRLDRNLRGKFGSPAYGKEELIAEFGAALSGAEIGLPAVMREDHARYVDSWLSVIAERKHRQTLLWALGEAERAAAFIRQYAGAGGEKAR